MAALDADFWTISMLFKATDSSLEKVVPQFGLRVLIHEHLSKFISCHRTNRLDPFQQPKFGGTAPKFGPPDRVEISSDDMDDANESTDDKDLESDPDDEQQTQTSDGPL